MENLITCSKVLYDKDVLDKSTEILKLKKIIKNYEKPQVIYSSVEEWEMKKQEAYNIIQNGINLWIVDNELETQFMFSGQYCGLTPNQRKNIPKYIEEALILLTKNSNWSKKTSVDIMYSIDGFINGIIKNDLWNLITTTINAEQLANIIYKNIEWQLDNGEHYPCILDKIAIFKCKKCEDYYTFISDDNICWECQNN